VVDAGTPSWSGSLAEVVGAALYASKAPVV